MWNRNPRAASLAHLRSRLACFLLLAVVFCCPAIAQPAIDQSDAGSSRTPPCTLERHVYTCNGSAFQKQLDQAKTVSLQTHSIDKYAQAQLRSLIAKKLGKTVVPEGSPSDLIFLLIPIGGEGMNINSNDTALATLRIYAVAPGNNAGDLIWAEVFTGHEDLPWPAVVNSLILQFRSHFHIQ